MSEADAATFRIFRASDAVELMADGCMKIEPYSQVQRDGVTKLIEAGYLGGSETKVLCNIPGFSLSHTWFKEGYPLPLHSHDSDCLYYIVAGKLRLGSEDLGARDSFFIPAGVPYTYKVGEGGVEVLEFRQANAFNFLNLAKGEGFWSRALEDVTERQDAWREALPPTSVA